MKPNSKTFTMSDEDMNDDSIFNVINSIIENHSEKDEEESNTQREPQ